LTTSEHPRGALLAGILVVFAAIAVYARFGTRAPLLHDDAIFVYGGQEMLHGVPPYLGIFDHKGPGATMLCCLGAWIGDLVGMDHLDAIRRLFFAIGIGSVIAVFALARTLFRSTRVALLSAAMFLAFARFGYHAASGPRPKTAVVLFQTLALLLMARRRWFAAGFSGALAGLVWQPTAIFALAAPLLAGTAAEPGRSLRSAGKALFGMSVPVVLVSLYFAASGAFDAFFEGAVLFNLRYVERSSSLRYRLFRIGEAIYESNAGLGFPILFGLLAIPLLFLWRSREKGVGPALLSDRFACLFWTLPAMLAWSLIDFQGPPDFFVFLPYAALGFAWTLKRGLDGLERELDLQARGRIGLTLLAFGALSGGGLYVAGYFHDDGLGEQRVEVTELFAHEGGAKAFFLGAPEAMVLAGRRNPTRYGFLMRGIDELIEDTEPGGFAGWLRALGHPDIVVVGEVALRSIDARHLSELRSWLSGWRLDEEAPGPWLVYRSRPDEAGS